MWLGKMDRTLSFMKCCVCGIQEIIVYVGEYYLHPSECHNCFAKKVIRSIDSNHERYMYQVMSSLERYM